MRQRTRIIISLAICVILSLVLISCAETTSNDDTDSNHENRMVLIEKDYITNAPDTFIYVDRYTKVMYIATTDGNITPMYDSNGNILIYEGEING